MIDTSNNTITTTNALVYKKVNDELFYLLAQENDSYWGLPGGAKEVEDNNLLTAIKRELKEELSLEESDYQVVETDIQKEFEYNHRQSSRFGKRGIVKFFIVEVHDLEKIKSSSEIQQVEWFTEKEASEKFTFGYVREGFFETAKLINKII